MIDLHSTEGFLLTFKQADLNKLKADCFAAIIKHHAEGHDDIRAQFRITFWRKKYLVVTRYVFVATERETNKAIKIYRGTTAMKKYIAAKWKFDHAQAKEIQWNIIKFECDGDSVRVSTEYNEQVEEAAKKDINAGIVDRTARGLTSMMASIADHIAGTFSKK